MGRFRKPSPQTRAVLAALMQSPRAWRHGYEISTETRLKSGTLYPILLRLEAQKLLEAEWRDSAHPGRPPRHVYRLTPDGAAFAREYAVEPPARPVRLAASPEGAQ